MHDFDYSIQKGDDDRVSFKHHLNGQKGEKTLFDSQ